tara:strand:- start:846 stop:1700 length:855 start_codon:yes stop_codon:yes gene_type:complete
VEPALEIQMVRENLALAIALWAGTKKGLITRDHLPTGRVSVPSDDGLLISMFNPLEMKSDRDLARCISNQVRGAVAFSAMQAHTTLERVYRNPPIQETDPDLQAARCAIYLLSNTLGQRMLAPAWVCPPAYRRRFEVRPASFVLDASALNGKAVYWEDFGGLEKYLALLEYCVSQLEQSAAGSDGTEGAVAAAPPNPAGQLSMELPDDNPVAPFLMAKCVAGPDARSLAKELYAGYVDWCRDTGRVPLVQRSFGMGLTKLGFFRRRRGRGRHWWEGIELAGTPT